jgi:hypothetical protein
VLTKFDALKEDGSESHHRNPFQMLLKSLGAVGFSSGVS